MTLRLDIPILGWVNMDSTEQGGKGLIHLSYQMAMVSANGKSTALVASEFYVKLSEFHGSFT